MPVYAYKGKRGTTYYIVYSVNGRRKTETIGKDKKLAEKVLYKNTKAHLSIIAKMSCGFAGFNGVSIFKKANL